MNRWLRTLIVLGVIVLIGFTFYYFMDKYENEVHASGSGWQCQFWDGFFDKWKEPVNGFRRIFGMEEYEYSCDEYYGIEVSGHGTTDMATGPRTNQESSEYLRGRDTAFGTQIILLIGCIGVPIFWWFRKSGGLQQKKEDH